jgi:large subunit ribosomal protein L1
VLKEIEAGKINFDILVSHPSMMPKLAKFARVLGPKGLMPNPKTGTVTEDVEKRVKELSHGQVNFKTEPENPIIHLLVGKVSFEKNQLTENINAIIGAVGKNKILKTTITATMGPGIRVTL